MDIPWREIAIGLVTAAIIGTFSLAIKKQTRMYYCALFLWGQIFLAAIFYGLGQEATISEARLIVDFANATNRWAEASREIAKIGGYFSIARIGVVGILFVAVLTGLPYLMDRLHKLKGRK